MKKTYEYENATITVVGKPDMDKFKAATKKFMEAVERDRRKEK